jgi:hypothetical protein
MMDVRRNPHRPIRTRRVAWQNAFDYWITANYRGADCIFSSNMLRNHLRQSGDATPRVACPWRESFDFPRLRLST